MDNIFLWRDFSLFLVSIFLGYFNDDPSKLPKGINRHNEKGKISVPVRLANFSVDSREKSHSDAKSLSKRADNTRKLLKKLKSESRHRKFMGVSSNCILRTLVLSISKYTSSLRVRNTSDHIENEHFQYKKRILAKMVYSRIYS